MWKNMSFHTLFTGMQNGMITVVGLIVSIKIVGPSPWNLLNITLYGKRVFVDVIRLRILKWGYYLRFSKWALNANPSVLIREEQRES